MKCVICCTNFAFVPVAITVFIKYAFHLCLTLDHGSQFLLQFFQNPSCLHPFIHYPSTVGPKFKGELQLDSEEYLPTAAHLLDHISAIPPREGMEVGKIGEEEGS